MSDSYNLHHSPDRRDHLQHRQERKFRTNKEEENDRFRQRYPVFEIPTSFYKVIHVNKNTSINDMHLMINHLQQCTQFTIDTESEKSNGKLALIQIQSIPPRLPLLMILVELAHLPPENSHVYVKIKECFELIFRSNNELYAWGNLATELSPAINYRLFSWPILASMFDIQLHFSAWYTWALTQYESSSPNHRSDDTSAININVDVNHCVLSNDIHYEPSPYRPGEKWSLQKAMIYAGHMFIDKTSTMNNWAGGLTDKNSTLPSHRRQIMINYAIYDCFTVTYFIRPIMECWCFNKLKNVNLIELFKTFQSRPLPAIPIIKSSTNKNKNKNKKIKDIDPQQFSRILDDELESISEDEEIYLSQITVPQPFIATNETINSNDQHLPNDETPTTNFELIIDADEEIIVNGISEDKPATTSEPQKKSNHQRRSLTSRKRRNKKRNNNRRKHRYHLHFTRMIYHRFRMPLIKQILKQYDIKYVHLKVVDGLLMLGVKNELIKHEYEHRLPEDTFSRRQYQRYYRAEPREEQQKT